MGTTAEASQGRVLAHPSSQNCPSFQWHFLNILRYLIEFSIFFFGCFVLFVLGSTTNNAQGLLQALSSGIIPVGSLGHKDTKESNSGLPIWKASVIPTVISLQPECSYILDMYMCQAYSQNVYIFLILNLKNIWSRNDKIITKESSINFL